VRLRAYAQRERVAAHVDDLRDHGRRQPVAETPLEWSATRLGRVAEADDFFRAEPSPGSPPVATSSAILRPMRPAMNANA
jgi:hypothetical protein